MEVFPSGRSGFKGAAALSLLLALLLFQSNPLAAQPVTTQVDLGQYQQVRYVSASTGSDRTGGGGTANPWQSLTNAFNVIGDASLVNRYAVLIAEGNYVDKGETPFAQDSWVDLYGGFDPADWSIRSITEHETILDGENQRRVVIAANHSRIDGLTVRNGLTASGGGGVLCANVDSATLSNCTITDSTAENGGAVDCYYSSPRITHCLVASNNARSGGAVSVGFESAPHIEACTLRDNKAGVGGGLFCEKRSRPTIDNCTLSNNTASRSGGVDCRPQSRVVITNCLISDNRAASAGGIYFVTSATATVDHCTITRNTAQTAGGVICGEHAAVSFAFCMITDNSAEYGGGGINCISSDPILTKCTISKNEGEWGAIFFRDSASPHLINCTLADNSSRLGGCLYCFASSPVLTNCILSNPGNEILVRSGYPKMTYCCVERNFRGAGNLSANPLFVDPLHGDYRLQDLSPCIDRGVAVGMPYNGVAPDLGAWETPPGYTPGPIPRPQVWYINGAGAAGGDGHSWTTAFRTVGDALNICSASDEIWVARGIYNEPIDMVWGLRLYGGFAGTETARDERDSGANSTTLQALGDVHPVITIKDVDNTSIDGFTIQGDKMRSVSFESVISATVRTRQEIT